MDNNINNQNTLFRFVSLRNPELTKKENQEKRFVFNPDVTHGVFYQAAANTNTAKWDAMLAAAESFSAFKSEKEIANLYPQHFELSDWITRNRDTITQSELAAKLQGLGQLKPLDEIKLWDNLYYQVLMQEDFYVKEAVIQLLVLQNILRNKDFLTEEIFVKQLLTAKVVLPKELFDELALMQYVEIEEEEDDDFVSKELEDARQREEARITSANIEGILSELKEIEVDHRKEGETKYKAAITEFQKINGDNIKTKLADYQKEYDDALRKIGEGYKNKNIFYKDKQVSYDHTELCNQPDVPYPELPEPPVFDYPEEPDIEKVKKNLAGPLDVLSSQVGNLGNITSFSKLKQTLTTNLQSTGQQVVDKVDTSTRMIVVGDSVMQIDGFVPLSDLFKFQLCSSKLTNGNYSVYMNIQLPSGYNVKKFVYNINILSTINLSTKPNNNISDTYFTSSLNGNVLTLRDMFKNTLTPFTQQADISGTITFNNGLKYEFSVLNFKLSNTFSGKLVKVENNTDSNRKINDFKPNTFGYRRLGIADYQKVVSKICRYEAGEVAHIENVMARELREKSTTSFKQRQVVETESQEIEKEKITDTSSVERFEMQSEIAKMLQQDRQFSANTYVDAAIGSIIKMGGGASFAASVSKQESNRQAINQAKEITQRASEHILSRVKNERTVSTTEEFTETNTHIFDNRVSGEHVSGVYRFINAVYKNRIYNYGKRLMYEFMVPQPAKLHQIAMSVINENNTVVLKKPEDPRTTVKIGITDFSKITKNNYKSLAAKYGVSVNEYPRENLTVNKSFSGAWVKGNEKFDGTMDIQLPEGYITKDASLKLFCKHDGSGSSQKHAVSVAFGDIRLYCQDEEKNKNITENNLKDRTSDNKYTLENYKDNVSFSYSVLNYVSFSITISINLKIDDTKIEQWKKETFEKIIAGYNSQLEAYNQSLAEQKKSGVEMLDSNPMYYRQIEQTVLRQNCISYLLPPNNSVRKFGKQLYEGDSITKFKINLNQEMDDYSSFVKFMEQAFEWDLISYIFYPYYWGAKEDWEQLYKFDSNDALFRSFMQAGMARVIVTVRPGFEKAVMHYMATGSIWNDGETPVIGDELYLSIVDELKEQEYEVDGSWETMLPTNLIALQKSGVAIDAEGLPVLDGDDAIKGSNSELGGGE